MAGESLTFLLESLRRRFGVPASEETTDGQLLTRFAAHQDEAAFAALMHRHGPMVLSVCRRVLPQPPDVEDAFQATFLMLVRKAGSIRNNTSVAGWLYRVAYHLALRTRASSHPRESPPRADERRPPQPEVEAAWHELQAVLDEELAGLPEKYRTPLVLCYLEGKTHEEAARELGWPAGTVKGRLARARDLMRRRLTRRGLAPVAGSFAAVLAVGTSSAAVPVPLAAATAKAALSGAGAVPSRVAALVEGLTRTLFLAKVKTTAAVVLAVGLATFGAGLLTRPLWRDDPVAQANNVPPPDARPAEVLPMRPAAADLHGDPLPAGALARMGTVRLRVGATVYAFRFSPDGRLLASGGDRAVILWKMPGGEEVHRFTGHQSRVLGIAFSPDGRTLASGSTDRTIRLWDLATGAEIRRFEGHRATVGHVVFAPDGRTLVSGSSDKTLRLWDVATGKELRQLRRPEADPATVAVWPLAFFPDSRTVASAEAEGRLRLWDATTGKPLPQTDWLPRSVSAVAYSRDGTTLATVAMGGSNIQLWDVAAGKGLRECVGHRDAVHALAFSPDGVTLASGCMDGTTRFWDVATGAELRRAATQEPQLDGLAFSPDGTLLASGRDTLLRLWDTATGQEVGPAAGHRGQVRAGSFLPDGRTLVSTGKDNTVRRWNALTGEELDHWDGPVQAEAVTAFAVAPDGKMVASGSQDRTIHLRDTVTGREVRRWPAHGHDVSALAFAPDGLRLASASWDKTVALWDVATGRELHRLRGHSGQVLTVAFSPDGKRLASGDTGGALRLWDAVTGKLLHECDGGKGGVRAVAFSPDGKTVAAAGGIHATRGAPGQLTLWEMATGLERGRWQGHVDRAYCVAFSPDGTLLVSGGGDQMIRWWDLAAGLELPPRKGHRGAVVSLAFSPNGRLLTSGSMDSTALVWPVTERPLRKAPEPLPPERLEALWADLAGTDGVRAYRAVWAFAGAPDQAVTLLQARLRPPATGEPETAAQSIRALRAIEVLERAGTPQARSVLKTLAESTWPVPIAEEASAALARLPAGR